MASLGLWAMTAALRLRFVPTLDYGEGQLLLVAQQIHSGVFPYSGPGTLPYVPLIYGPLYPALWALILPWTGMALWGGRLIAVLGAAALAGCLTFMVRRLTGDRLAAVVAGGLFLWSGPSVGWTGIARVDFLALPLALGGLTIILFGSYCYRGVGTVLFFLALLTRQTMVAAPLAAYLYLFHTGERRAALLHALTLLCLVLGAFAILQIGSHGGFWRDAVVGNLSPWRWDRLWWLWALTLRRSPLLLAVGVAGLPLLWRRTAQMWGLGVYMAVVLLMTVLGAKQGAGRNYLLEAMAACAMVTTLTLCPQSLWQEPRRCQSWLPATLVLLQFGLLFRLPGLYTDLSRASNPAMDTALIQAVRAEPGEVLSENLGAVLAADKRLWLEPATAAQQVWAGLWDQRPLLGMIRQQEFGLVVTRGCFITLSKRAAGSAIYRRSAFCSLLVVLDRALKDQEEVMKQVLEVVS
jgi:hypothetical protein